MLSGLPAIREWTEQHFEFPGYITGFGAEAARDPAAVRRELGWSTDERVCVVSVGGSGVGAHLPGIGFFLLARREPGHTAVENHRQVPAYHYPDRYGPRPPSFARASRLPGGPLLISGTASILGHRTVHPGELASQCRTTLANLATLSPGLRSLQAVKVYVRHAGDVDEVRELCAPAFGGEVAYFTTDLCRSDLLVEIDWSRQLAIFSEQRMVASLGTIVGGHQPGPYHADVSIDGTRFAFTTSSDLTVASPGDEETCDDESPPPHCLRVRLTLRHHWEGAAP